MRKILYVIPDYNFATLQTLKFFLANPKFSVTVVAPYNIEILSMFSFASKKIVRRKRDWENTIGNSKIRLITNNITHLIFFILQSKLKKRKIVISNILKRNLEKEIIKKINFTNFDILYSFDTCSLVYQTKAKKHGLKLILESRGNYIEETLNIHKKLNRTFNTSLQEKEVEGERWIWKIKKEVEIADKIIVYSDFQKQSFLKVLGSEDYFHKIPIPSKFKATEKAKQYSQDWSLLFIGNRAITKGLNILIDIWISYYNNIPENISLSIIGNCSSNEMNYRNKRINFLGYLPPNELHSYLNENNLLLVHPTFYDSFGMVVLEALSQCIPVITNKNCGASEYIKNGENGFVYEDPFDFNNLKNLIIKSIKNPSLLERFSENIKFDNPLHKLLKERESNIKNFLNSI